ncbi:hypothetical protein PT015_20350 [Candidatus Mycobacterium wuenschmannii]|uniref:ATP-grasp domain-containing protein n=1 Tax=Candidatus Mycobacterium wuenschmannii TaxID=3027808 RepID=A0ABY8VU76_9MYCO|nr:hypothetical protein [Candidatus Mycobacterium wuenschmannii]WIM87185.1 hypothetical protein PT015_20350 [Candidatus Mycobacterium wuenschmannii]
MRIDCISRSRISPHPLTGEFHEWAVVVDGDEIDWQSYAGPLRFDDTDFAIATRKLLSIEPGELPEMVSEHIEFAPPSPDQPRLMVHSTTPYASSFETDLSAMVQGRPVLDLTTYVEARGLYLSRRGDLVIGRTQPWQRAVVPKGVERLMLPDADYYYLSQALLRRAVDGGDRDPVMRQVIEFVRANPSTVMCPYDFEPEFQLFATWLARAAGLQRIRVDANDFRLGIWNRKRMLHPTVRAALDLDHQVAGRPGPVILECEHRASEAFAALHAPIRVLPGYAVERRDSRGDFVRDLLRAGALLRERYGLSRACLKPSDGGNGGRITPGIELDHTARLVDLAASAWELGGDQVLEAHVTYFERDVGGERVLTTPSAHVRSGELLDGLTLQFMRGTSWRGNIFVGLTEWSGLGLDPSVYSRLRATMTDLHQRLGLLHCGIDFAVGTIGGVFGDTAVAAVQDINPKVTGALFLREFMARHPEVGPGAATRVLSPDASESADRIRELVSALSTADHPCEEVAVVPGRWAMIATSAATSLTAGAQALAMERKLAARH